MNYELKTIKDIFDKVPEDRVKTCMSELTELILNCKTKSNAMAELAAALTGDKNNIETIFPEPVTWMDDGKGEVIVNSEIVVKA